MNSFLKYNWPSILWAALILYACMVPGSHLPTIKIPNIDKIVHLGMYIGLSALMVWGWRKQTGFATLHQNTFIKIFVIACTYGLCIEIMQELFTTTRHFEWLDELTDAVGAAIGGGIAVKLFK